MKPAEVSIRYSLFVNLMAVFLLIAGAVSLFRINREAFPNFSFDMVTVMTIYPGAPPEEVEKLVTTPLEKEIKGVDYIKEIESVSTEGISVIIVKIDPDAPSIKDVVSDIQQEVDSVQDLPEDTEDPVVTELNVRNSPVIEVDVSGWVPEETLQHYALQLEDRLAEINGVASVTRRGWHDPEMHIEVDPDKMREAHLSLDEVVDALRLQNVNIPGGDSFIDGQEVLLRTDGEFRTVEEIKNVVVRSSDVGNWITIGQIATVTKGFEDSNTLLRTRGKPTIALVVVKKESGDIISIVDKVFEEITAFKTTLPPDITIDTADDISFYVKRRLRVLINNGWIGFFLVIGALLLFLSRQVTAMTVVGIPVAIMASIAILYICGGTINLITMFAMIMVLGLVVDDAIVVSENVYRHMELGRTPREAVIIGTQEVAKPVIATVLTTIAAFLPLFFMTGIFGKFVRWMPIIVTIVLTASLMECLFVLPTHLADFVRPGAEQAKKDMAPWFQKLTGWYARVLERALRFRYALWGLFVAAVLLAAVLLRFFVPFVLFPSEGIEIFYIRAEAPIGTDLQTTSQMTMQIEELVHALPDKELDVSLTQIGIHLDETDDPYTKRGSHLAQVVVYLTPPQSRSRTADEIIADLREQTQRLQGWTHVWFDSVNAGPPSGKPIAVKIQGDDFSVSQQIAREFEGYLAAMDGVADVRNDHEFGKLRWKIDVDPRKASLSGLTVADVAQTVRTAYEGTVATEIKPIRTEDEIDVVVKLTEAARNDVRSLEKLLVQNKFDLLVPLNKVASWSSTPGLSFVKHLDGKRVLTVSGEVNRKVLTSLEVNRRLAKHFHDVEERYPGYLVTYGGEQKDTQESLNSLKQAFFITAVLIFFLLATNFQSLHQPLIVMMTIPFAIVGVIFTFWLHGKPLSFLALLGTIGLAGVVVNDSIILVDFINYLRREEKLPRRTSIMQAGKLRLRQVLLTTITTCAGLFPVAYGIGGSDPFLKPMALAISWGLAFATVLTLILVPATYAIVDDLAEWVRTHTRRRAPATPDAPA